MADRNNNDQRNGDRGVPVCRSDERRRSNNDRSERDIENHHNPRRQQGNRGYRMDRHRPPPPSSRWDRDIKRDHDRDQNKDNNYYGRGAAAGSRNRHHL